ncbi:MAG: hypothetical protein JWN44_6846 [Myxococcales bacterium]|nr:hypothetical protein [Myxococcales bacterium]
MRGSSTLIVGPAGSGKTVLTNQISFNLARRGGRAIYVTLLTESHGHIVSNLSTLDFFDANAVGDAVYYVSGAAPLLETGGAALLQMITELVHERRPTVLTIDCLNTVQLHLDNEQAFRTFLRDLDEVLAIHGCTGLYVGHLETASIAGAFPVVDTILRLDHERAGTNAMRRLQVTKSRGSGALEGQHAVVISRAGLTVFPRLESMAAAEAPSEESSRPRLSFGIPSIDDLVGGGLPQRTSTVLLGAPGSGKTLLATSFLAAGAAAGDPGLYFGFFEWPSRIVEGAARVGIPLAREVERGAVEMLWRPPYRGNVDALALELFAAIERRKVRRLVVDGLIGLVRSGLFEERMMPFFAAFTNELRRMSVTAILTDETANLAPSDVTVPYETASLLAENLVAIGYREVGPMLERVIAVLKLRYGNYDRCVHRFQIGAEGLSVGDAIATEAGAGPAGGR